MLKVKTSGSEDYGKKIKALICGNPGAGKTLTSSTWPNVLYASAEGGLMSVADRKVNYVDIDSSTTLLELKNALSQSPAVREKTFGFPVETVVIDTIDEIQRIFIRERLADQRREAMVLQDWGWLGERMIATINGFRNLDLNVVFTAHLKEVKDEETGKLWLKPGLQGATADQIAAYVDLAFVLKSEFKSEVVDGKPQKILVRSLQTLPDPYSTWVKDRSGKLPNPFPLNFDDDYARIAEYVFKGYDSIPEQVSSDVNVVLDETFEPPKVKTEAQKQATALKRADKPKVEEPVKPVEKVEEKVEQKEDSVDKEMVSEFGNCTDCGDPIETKEVMTLSRLRFKKPLDKKCYEALKEKD